MVLAAWHLPRLHAPDAAPATLPAGHRARTRAHPRARQLLALELLKVVLENSGPAFRSSERFHGAIRQYLCLSLLKNAASSIPAALQLSASIFLSLLQRFRAGLKAEVGVFFPMVYLKVLEPPAAGAGAGGAGGGGAGSLAVNAYSYK